MDPIELLNERNIKTILDSVTITKLVNGYYLRLDFHGELIKLHFSSYEQTLKYLKNVIDGELSQEEADARSL